MRLADLWVLIVCTVMVPSLLMLLPGDQMFFVFAIAGLGMSVFLIVQRLFGDKQLKVLYRPRHNEAHRLLLGMCSFLLFLSSSSLLLGTGYPNVRKYLMGLIIAHGAIIGVLMVEYVFILNYYSVLPQTLVVKNRYVYYPDEHFRVWGLKKSDTFDAVKLCQEIVLTDLRLPLKDDDLTVEVRATVTIDYAYARDSGVRSLNAPHLQKTIKQAMRRCVNEQSRGLTILQLVHMTGGHHVMDDDGVFTVNWGGKYDMTVKVG